MAKIYVVNASADDLMKIRQFCNNEGFICKVSKGFGRPYAEVDVQKLLNASTMQNRRPSYRDLGKMIGCSSGTAYRRYKEYMGGCK